MDDDTVLAEAVAHLSYLRDLQRVAREMLRGGRVDYWHAGGVAPLTHAAKACSETPGLPKNLASATPRVEPGRDP
jgi:hypothetical protein